MKRTRKTDKFTIEADVRESLLVLQLTVRERVLRNINEWAADGYCDLPQGPREHPGQGILPEVAKIV